MKAKPFASVDLKFPTGETEHIPLIFVPREFQDQYANKLSRSPCMELNSTQEKQTNKKTQHSNQAGWKFGQELNEIFPQIFSAHYLTSHHKFLQERDIVAKKQREIKNKQV